MEVFETINKIKSKLSCSSFLSEAISPKEKSASKTYGKSELYHFSKQSILSNNRNLTVVNLSVCLDLQ